MKQKTKIIAVLVLLCVFTANFASAALVNCGTRNPDGSVTQCKLGDLFNLVVIVINFLLGMAALVAVVYIFWGGIQMVFASANPEQAKSAKTTLVNAVTGFILTLGAYLLINIGIQIILGDGRDIQSLLQFWQ